MTSTVSGFGAIGTYNARLASLCNAACLLAPGTLPRSERVWPETAWFEELLLHLLKWHFQPRKRKGGWRASIVEQRDELKQLLEESPRLRGLPSLALGKSYLVARAKAADETSLAETTFPDDCPYSAEDILDDVFLPGPPWKGLRSDDKLKSA